MENALQFTPAGGMVTLSARKAQNAVQLEISDTGTGIPPEELPRVFERFYRVDKSRQRDIGGTGLGLAIARSIVRAHGGRIWAESEPGKGAQIILEIPVF